MESNNWKGRKKTATKAAKHQYLVAHYGNPKKCENPDCKGKSNWFEWALKHGREYTHNIKDYWGLCRSCHRKYDLTDAKISKAVKNLHWNTKVIRTSKYGKRFKERYT